MERQRERSLNVKLKDKEKVVDGRRVEFSKNTLSKEHVLSLAERSGELELYYKPSLLCIRLCFFAGFTNRICSLRPLSRPKT